MRLINPDCVVLKETDDTGLTCKINKEGVIANSIRVFTSLEAATSFHNIIYGTDESRNFKGKIEFNNNTEYYEVTYYETNNEITNSVLINDKCLSYNEAQNYLADYIITNIVPEESLLSSQYQVIIDSDTGFATGLNYIECEPDENRTLQLVYNYNPQLYHEKLRDKYQHIQQEQEQKYRIYAKVVNIIDGERDENGEWTSDNKGLLQDYQDKYDKIWK